MATPTVAVIDDDATSRRLVRALLKAHCTVVEYASGPEALAAIPHAPPDLVLLDLSLPDMDGREILSRLRADERLRRLPVIALTAGTADGDREACRAAGFDGYLAKPIPGAQALLDAIRGLLEARGGADAGGGGGQPPGAGAPARSPDAPARGEAIVVRISADLAPIVPGYLENIRQDGAAMQEALGRGDLKMVRRLGHNLKGTGGGYGFDALSEIGARLEAAALREDAEAARRHVGELLHYLHHVEVIHE